MGMPSTGPRRFVIVDGSTIRETRDREEETRPKKRQRVEDDAEGEETYGPHTGSTVSVKDPEYYKEGDGADCIVRVENTLFKVHRHLLLQSESIQYTSEDFSETTDEKPMELLAATVDEFRALLWALYSSPHTVSAIVEHTDAEVEPLLRVASIAHKYHFLELHSWVTRTLEGFINDKVFIQSCSSATFTRMVDAAVQCNLPSDALSSLVTKWGERVAKNSIPSVPAMLAADKHDLLELRGIAYYVHIQDMLDRQTSHTAVGAAQLRTDPKLNNGQVMRVLSGYWSLVNFWERFRRTPLKLQCAQGCSPEAHTVCMATWERRWNSSVGWKRILGYNSADILALLDCLWDQLKGDEELKMGTASGCRTTGLAELKKTVESTRKGLADHFFGCV